MPVSRVRGAFCTAVLCLFHAPFLTAQTYDLVAGEPAAVNHYPGPDGRVGNGDDVISAQPTAIIGSDPNVHGSYSFAVYESFGPGDPALPGANTSVSFFTGTVDLDPSVVTAGTGQLLTGASATGTGFGQGLGVSTLDITNVDSGTWNGGTGAFTTQADLELGVAGLTQIFDDVSVSGEAIVVQSADFGTPTGNAWVDNVLIPRAQALNADSLVYMSFDGMLPVSPPMVIINAPFTVVLAGFEGVPSGSTADIGVTKTVPTGPFGPGDAFTFTLAVDNAGPGNAAGVRVDDPFPDELDWVSDTCGAGPPAGGVLTWNTGMVNSGGNASCDVAVQVNGQANFDFENGASAYAALHDPDLSNNVATVQVAGTPGTAPEGLAQAPDGVTGFQSDSDCDACATGAQGVAENFRVDDQFQLGGVVFFGGYTDNQPFADRFTIEIYDQRDVSPAPGIDGVPGDPVASFSVPVTRTATGNLVAGSLDEYRYEANVSANLSRGVYWVLIYNDSASGSPGGDWFWETGSADAEGRSVPTVAANVVLPPQTRWSPNPDVSMALSLEGGSGAVEVPAMEGFGLILMGLIVFLIALRRLTTTGGKNAAGAACWRSQA